jgi:DNA polymerase sigma
LCYRFAAIVTLPVLQVSALPPLRPLVLVIKAMLKEAGLNEVFTGGLSSYSLVNMVVAHLQAEGMQAAPVTEQQQQHRNWAGSVISQEQVQQHLTQLAQSSAAAAAAGAGSASGSSSSSGCWDLGCLLHGFFVRYGELFSYQYDAVSVAAGGIIFKHRSWVKPGMQSLTAFTLIIVIALNEETERSKSPQHCC